MYPSVCFIHSGVNDFVAVFMWNVPTSINAQTDEGIQEGDTFSWGGRELLERSRDELKQHVKMCCWIIRIILEPVTKNESPLLNCKALKRGCLKMQLKIGSRGFYFSKIYTSSIYFQIMMIIDIRSHCNSWLPFYCEKCYRRGHKSVTNCTPIQVLINSGCPLLAIA